MIADTATVIRSVSFHAFGIERRESAHDKAGLADRRAVRMAAVAKRDREAAYIHLTARGSRLNRCKR
jgi:hypothetical protein